MDKENEEYKIFIEKQKRALLCTLMQEKFEERVMEFIESEKYESMEELDAWIDNAIRTYFNEIDTIKDYYDSKLKSMSAFDDSTDDSSEDDS